MFSIGAFNQKKALVGAFSVIVKLRRLIVCSSNTQLICQVTPWYYLLLMSSVVIFSILINISKYDSPSNITSTHETDGSGFSSTAPRPSTSRPRPAPTSRSSSLSPRSSGSTPPTARSANTIPVYLSFFPKSLRLKNFSLVLKNISHLLPRNVSPFLSNICRL